MNTKLFGMRLYCELMINRHLGRRYAKLTRTSVVTLIALQVDR